MNGGTGTQPTPAPTKPPNWRWCVRALFWLWLIADCEFGQSCALLPHDDLFVYLLLCFLLVFRCRVAFVPSYILANFTWIDAIKKQQQHQNLLTFLLFAPVKFNQIIYDYHSLERYAIPKFNPKGLQQIKSSDNFCVNICICSTYFKFININKKNTQSNELKNKANNQTTFYFAT